MNNCRPDLVEANAHKWRVADQALDGGKFVEDAYKGFEERGGRVRINILGSCMFVGQ